ncbi:hypothetical protein EC843_101706 [Buttiauxella sp. JUb87]|uniref:hypothetical protein n=1 Tax=Buttiauxella sp. JUb87 TaxID=2485129 RepID=UPI00105EA23E|nr:hypothetical protein [Buttiauxella sp. JUb87]TDN54655.1 hypothetical protein EC843_101706 [Buttiauxella sp. JUb87]
MATEKIPAVVHAPINVVLTIENGKVIHTRPVQNGEVTASMETFLWMAERAGYTVIPPEKGDIDGSDSNSYT